MEDPLQQIFHVLNCFSSVGSVKIEWTTEPSLHAIEFLSAPIKQLPRLNGLKRDSDCLPERFMVTVPYIWPPERGAIKRASEYEEIFSIGCAARLPKMSNEAPEARADQSEQRINAGRLPVHHHGLLSVVTPNMYWADIVQVFSGTRPCFLRNVRVIARKISV